MKKQMCGVPNVQVASENLFTPSFPRFVFLLMLTEE
jgi:hypothetical protein